MPSEGSKVTSEPTVEALRCALAEAREQQAATAEILASISSSVTDANRVFAKIAASAARLCDTHDATIFQVDGNDLRIVANHGPIPPVRTLPLMRGIVTGRAVLDMRTIHVADLHAESDEYPEGRERARLLGHRTILAIPLIHAHEAIGAITIRRTEVRPFTDRQIELLKIFADQAIIAIENTRLFNETKEALERQTATANILQIISSSPTDVNPVCEAILENACRLCDSKLAAVFRFDGRLLHVVATKNWPAEISTNAASRWPMEPDPRTASGRVVLTKRVVLLEDTLADQSYDHRIARAGGWRRMLGAPMLRGNDVIGVIMVAWRDPGPILPRQVELLRTFAHQAVIAIENTRLFEEVQKKNYALTEAHAQVSNAFERETATSAILRVIGSSPTDVQPVFETIARSGVNVCNALGCVVLVVDGGMVRVAATHGVRPERLERFHREYPLPLSAEIDTAQTIRRRCMFHLADIENNPSATAADIENARLAGYRTRLMVPMVRGEHTLGLIAVTREDPTPFPDQLVELLKTFADQAVIAIENARLFEEVQARTAELTESLEYQTAISEVLGVISRSPSQLQPVLDTIVATARRLCEADRATIMRLEDGKYRFAARDGQFVREFEKLIAEHPITPGDKRTIAGRVSLAKDTVHIEDIQQDPEYTAFVGVTTDDPRRTMLGVPLLRDATVIGVIVLSRIDARPFSRRQIDLVPTFADQAVIAIENTRLLQQVQARTRELAKTVEDLEIASQHKSQFVANMSHELRTPLAAILGYAELIQEGFYEPQGPKALDALTRIRSNGKHLLSLINTVLDIAKIESGQFTLNMTEYAIESMVETVRSATESLAQNKRLGLRTEVAKSLPIGLGDEQRLTQVLLNLVGNAIKFTDAGEVSIAAGERNGHFSISVTDTGLGIPLDQQNQIFEQFHQVDSSNTKAKGGTGLGLAIAKQIVEMHGGRIWVESTLGKGSTFQMEIPTRAEFRKRAL